MNFFSKLIGIISICFFVALIFFPKEAAAEKCGWEDGTRITVCSDSTKKICKCALTSGDPDISYDDADENSDDNVVNEFYYTSPGPCLPPNCFPIHADELSTHDKRCRVAQLLSVEPPCPSGCRPSELKGSGCRTLSVSGRICSEGYIIIQCVPDEKHSTTTRGGEEEILPEEQGADARQKK